MINGYISYDLLINPITNYALYGDVNMDGKVSSYDATLVRQYFKGIKTLSPQQLKNADVNVDGIIDETDATLIQEFVVKMHEGTLPFKPIK